MISGFKLPLSSTAIGTTATTRVGGHGAAKLPKGATSKLGMLHQQNHQKDQQQDEELSQLTNQPSVRNIIGFIERFERFEAQELLAQMSAHWLLSLDDFKIPIEHPHGLISQMMPLNDDHIHLLIPYDEDIPHLDYREIHQIVRELTVGIYVLNQHPYLQLHANYNETTSSQLPPAYIETRLGQLMINTDYWLKALWHGAFFTREKRIKFCEKWRQLFDTDGVSSSKKPLLHEFLGSGLTDLARDADYGKALNKSGSNTNQLPMYSNVSLAPRTNLIGPNAPFSDSYNELADYYNLTEDQIKQEIGHFADYLNDMSVMLTFGLDSIKNYKNMYQIDASHSINICSRADSERIKNGTFARLKPIMNMQEKFLRENLSNKPEVKKNLKVLGIVGFLVPLLIGLKRRMKIPEMNNLLPLLTGEEVRTERELPPLMIGNDFKPHLFNCSINSSADNSNDQAKYFNMHGGIQFELETCTIKKDCESEFEKEYARIAEESSKVLKTYLDSEQQLHEYKVPVVHVNNKKYWCLRIDFEGYYAQFPQKPYWVHRLTDDLYKLKPKRLPVTIDQVYYVFKKYFGYKKATKYKTPSAGLRASAQRGLLSIFQSFTRKTPVSELAKHDEFGLSLMHYAAISNNPLIITTLILLGIDTNIKQQIDYMAIGPMPLHYAARCGSLDSLSCLLANYANISFSDHEGWSPIHHAAFFDNVPAIRLLVRRQNELLEITTRSESRKTPLLVAASGGCLEAVKCLISLGAKINFQDENGHNVIHTAAHKGHSNIVNFFIVSSFAEVPTWKILINMVGSAREEDKNAGVKCLQLLTNHNKKHWRSILDAGGIVKLSDILIRYSNSLKTKTNHHTEYETITLNAISVLCNLSDQPDVKRELNNVKDMMETLINIIGTTRNEDIQSGVSILIADISSIEEHNKVKLAQSGCLDKLLELLDSSAEDLLVNTVNAVEVICLNNVDNQNYFSEHGIFLKFIDLFELESDLLKSSVSAAIAALTHQNVKNQNLALDQGLIKPLVDQLKSRNMTVQLKVGLAIESLSFNNQAVQNIILQMDAISHLIKLLEKMYYVGATIRSNMEDWSIIVREQAAFTLWTLAGSLKQQRKMIAEKIGIAQILSMIMSKSEKLQFVGSKCIFSLALENAHYQHVIIRENTIDQLLRLLRMEKTSNRVILATVEAIAALCIGVAHVNNDLAQSELIDKGAIKTLLEILDKTNNKYIHVETAHSLACLMLNLQHDEYVNNISKNIDIKAIVDLLKTDDLELRLKAGLAVTVFAFNNNDKQYDIRKSGGISYDLYKVFLEKDTVNSLHLCKACFQVIVLARVIYDRDLVWLTALAISKLVHLLLLDDDQVVIQTASYLSSLAHTRTGITDAMVACDAVDILCDHLYSENGEIRHSCAAALGYLSFNRTASRLMLHNCRNVPNLFKTLMSLLTEGDKISKQFVDSFETAVALGLPKLLVKNRVKFYDPNNPRSKAFAPTGRTTASLASAWKHEQANHLESESNVTFRHVNTSIINRSQSAPLKIQSTMRRSAKQTFRPAIRPVTQLSNKLQIN